MESANLHVGLQFLSLQSMKSHFKYPLLPLTAMLLFVLLCVIAAFYYPGGSAIEPESSGFSIRYNYLCDLLDVNTISGLDNPGRFWARSGLMVLCAGLIYLWANLPYVLGKSVWYQRVMPASALMALFLTGMLTPSNHDLLVRISGGFGAIASALAVLGLWRSQLRFLAALGTWTLLIFLVNYFLYETGAFLFLLPQLQKLTFLSFLMWFTAITLHLNRQKIVL